MGWYGAERPRGVSHLAFFQCEYPGLIDGTSVGTVFYGAFQDTRDRQSFVYGLVIPFYWSAANAQGLNFWWRDGEDESLDPSYCACPGRILDLLTPVDDMPLPPASKSNSQTWRNECRAYWERQRSRLRLTNGLRFRTAKPLHFSNGVVLQEFEVVDASERIVRPLVLGGRYRLQPYHLEQAIAL